MDGLTFEYGVKGSALSSMKVGGAIKRLCRPRNEAEFLEALRRTDAPFLVLGNCSNVIFASKGYDGTVIMTERLTSLRDTEDGFVCGAGYGVSAAACHAAERALSGLEFAYGIPGSVGGAVCMNAGAYGGQVKDVLRRVRCASRDGQVLELSAEEARLSYRKSLFSEAPLYVLSAEFWLKRGERGAIERQMARNMAARREKQPLKYPSCGSVFKRPEGHYAGALIEQCGLKGLSVGKAQVSEKHAGFVINRGGATGDEVIELIRQVQKTVFEKAGILLETEVMIY